MSASDDIADEMVMHQIDLMRYSESVREKVLGHLYDLEEDIAKKVSAKEQAGKTLTPFQQQQTENLIAWSKGAINSAYAKNHQTMKSELIELADLEKDGHVRMLNDALGAQIFRTGMTRNELEVLVSNSLIQGSPAKDWWAKQSADLQGKFAQQVRLGVSQGETNDQIVKRIRGAPTGQKKVLDVGDGKKKVVNVHGGGVMDVSKRDATSLVRTAVQTTSNDVLAKLYAENGDVLRGVQALATLDKRTSPVCRARDKKAWALPSADQMQQRVFVGDKPKPGKPPAAKNAATGKAGGAKTPPTGKTPPKTKGNAGKPAPVAVPPPPPEPPAIVQPAPAAPAPQPFAPDVTHGQFVQQMQQLPGWSKVAVADAFQSVPSPHLAEIGNAAAKAAHHFGELAAPSSFALKEHPTVANAAAHYDPFTGPQGSVNLSPKWWKAPPVKLNKAVANANAIGHTVATSPGGWVSHELGHKIHATSGTTVKNALAYMTKHPPTKADLSAYGTSNYNEGVAEAFSAVLQAKSRDELSPWQLGFLDALNDDLAAIGKPLLLPKEAK